VKSRSLGSWLLDVVCGLVAYVGSRWIWGGHHVFEKLHLELLTFVLIYLVLQALVRGRSLARKGR
jgi:hypothetical protein